MFEGLLGAFLNGPDNSWGEGFPYRCSQLFQKMVVLHPEVMKTQIEGCPDFCTYSPDCFFPTMTGYESNCTDFVPIADSSIECAVLGQACLYSRKSISLCAQRQHGLLGQEGGQVIFKRQESARKALKAVAVVLRE